MMLLLFARLVAHYSNSLTLRKEGGVDYAMFPWHKNRCSGFVKMRPRSLKKSARSNSTVVCVIHYAFALH